jgi:hypothetical protein
VNTHRLKIENIIGATEALGENVVTAHHKQIALCCLGEQIDVNGSIVGAPHDDTVAHSATANALTTVNRKGL